MLDDPSLDGAAAWPQPPDGLLTSEPLAAVGCLRCPAACHRAMTDLHAGRRWHGEASSSAR